MLGIYKITNSIDNTNYIGKSKDIKIRIRKHKYRLAHGIHKYNSFHKGFNMSIGGDGCLEYKHTEQEKNENKK